MQVNIELNLPVIARFIPDIDIVSRQKPVDLYFKKSNGVTFYFGISNTAMMHNLFIAFLNSSYSDVQTWIKYSDIVIVETTPGHGEVVKMRSLHYGCYGAIIPEIAVDDSTST